MNFGSKQHLFLSEAFLSAESPCVLSVTASDLTRWVSEVVVCFAIWEIVYFTNNRFIKNFMKILKRCLRIFLIAINSLFSNENEFCLVVKVCILKDFQISAFYVKPLNEKKKERKEKRKTKS